MGKFKVGDRVRIVDADGGGKLGHEHVIAKAEEDDYYEFERNAYVIGLFGKRLELVRAADWQPKIGERVRGDREVVDHWNKYWAKKRGVTATADTVFFVVGHNLGGVHISTTAGGHGPCWPSIHLTAWQPQIGERVRVTYPGWEGEGEVYDVNGRNTFVTMRTGNYAGEQGGFFHSEIEPAAPAKPLVAATSDYLAEEYGPGVAPKPKFKVGDRVRLINTAYTFDGSLAEAVEAARSGDVDLFRVRVFDNEDAGDEHWFVRTSNLEPAPPAATTQDTAIVALIEDGQPKPAKRPYVHTTQASAEKEAKRLADRHKGKKFGVFVLTGEPALVERTFDHKWQRLAATGRKVDAIKELRGITGMGMKPAKDAVEYFLAA